MNRKPTKFLRLKDNHPTMGKLYRLITLAEELGLYFQFDQNYCIIQDEEQPGVDFFVQDTDHEGEAVADFPPAMDYVVIRHNPAYLEMEKQEAEKRAQEAAEAIRIAEEKRVAARAAAEARRKAEEEAAAIALEQKERAELARLKTKYKE